MPKKRHRVSLTRDFVARVKREKPECEGLWSYIERMARENMDRQRKERDNAE